MVGAYVCVYVCIRTHVRILASLWNHCSFSSTFTQSDVFLSFSTDICINFRGMVLKSRHLPNFYLRIFIVNDVNETFPSTHSPRTHHCVRCIPMRELRGCPNMATRFPVNLSTTSNVHWDANWESYLDGRLPVSMFSPWELAHLITCPWHRPCPSRPSKA